MTRFLWRQFVGWWWGIGRQSRMSYRLGRSFNESMRRSQDRAHGGR